MYPKLKKNKKKKIRKEKERKKEVARLFPLIVAHNQTRDATKWKSS